MNGSYIEIIETCRNFFVSGVNLFLLIYIGHRVAMLIAGKEPTRQQIICCAVAMWLIQIDAQNNHFSSIKDLLKIDNDEARKEE